MHSQPPQQDDPRAILEQPDMGRYRQAVIRSISDTYPRFFRDTVDRVIEIITLHLMAARQVRVSPTQPGSGISDAEWELYCLLVPKLDEEPASADAAILQGNLIQQGERRFYRHEVEMPDGSRAWELLIAPQVGA